MNFFIDYNDNRTKYLKTFLKDFKTYEIAKENFCFAKNNDVFVYAPNKKWSKEELQKLPNNIKLFCGKIDSILLNILKEKEINYTNFLEDEMFAIENAKLTAEGLLSLIIEKTQSSIFKNNFLIFGAGRIAKALAVLFIKLNIKFSIATFSKKSYYDCFFLTPKNYFEYEFFKDIKNFSVIINTRPERFFNQTDTQKFNQGCLFFETASIDCIDEKWVTNFEYIKAPALPQKYSYQSASKLMLNKILGEIKWKT